MPAIRRTTNSYAGVHSFDDLLDRARRNTGMDPVRRTEHVRAWINQSRWVAMCPMDNNAMVVDPDWPEIVCIDCGSIYALEVPPARKVVEIETLLADRPEPFREWLPGESVADLAHQNRRHGLHERSAP